MFTEKAAHELRSLIGQDRLITDPVELVVYEVDAAQDRGAPQGVVFPRSIEAVQQIARWAVKNKVPLIGRGAGTGLSGGAVAEKGGLIVEFSLMNHILEIDLAGRTAQVEPGVVNLALDEKVKSLGLYYPPDPASGRSATLGGNVAENAGGPHCFKYGVTTNYLTGLECVLASGRVLHLGGGAFDYPEYDFVRLITGSEGTLGLVTRISVRLLCNPSGVKTMMAAFDSVEQAGKAVSAVIAAGLVPATMEMMDQKIARIIENYAHAGLLTEAGALLIVEVDGYPASLNPQMEEVAEILQKNNGYSLRIAGSLEERDKIWYGRKSAAGAMARLAPAYLLLDGTVPRSRLAEALEATNQICDENGLQVGYVFHAGDGNLHPFILMYPSDPEQVRRAHQAGGAFMHKVVDLGGSITGEHGVGIEKRRYMPLMFNPTEMGIMQQVKQIFDPDGLMNPGKVFPEGAVDIQGPEVEAGELSGHLMPADARDAQRCLAGLTKMRRPAVIRGGPGPDQPDQDLAVIHTSAMQGIVEYAPQDLYITAQAGSSFEEVQAYLKKEGKWIPAAPAWRGATLGGLLAANRNAPLRMRYGSLSDQVLSLTVVLGDGRILRAGRPVVKNVAGYDLAKLFVGSLGTLGLITQATFKIMPLPRAVRSMFLPAGDLLQGIDWGQLCLKLATVASAVLLFNGTPQFGVAFLPEASYWLAVTVEGTPQDVDAEVDAMQQVLKAAGAPEPIFSEAITGTQVWQDTLSPQGSPKMIVRAGVPPKHLAEFVKTQRPALERGRFLLDFASGFAYTTVDADELEARSAWTNELRHGALRLGGYLLALDMPKEWQGKLIRSGYQSEALDLMRSLKKCWDPAGILNPGAYLFELE